MDRTVVLFITMTITNSWYYLTFFFPDHGACVCSPMRWYPIGVFRTLALQCSGLPWLVQHHMSHLSLRPVRYKIQQRFNLSNMIRYKVCDTHQNNTLVDNQVENNISWNVTIIYWTPYQQHHHMHTVIKFDCLNGNYDHMWPYSDNFQKCFVPYDPRP